MYADAARPGRRRHRRRGTGRATCCRGTRTTRGRRRSPCGCSARCTGWCSSGGPARSRRTTRRSAGPGSRTAAGGVPRAAGRAARRRSAEWLDRAPQTNEVGRATALYGGLLHARPATCRSGCSRSGRSAGLNLRADRFAYVDDDGRGSAPSHRRSSDVVLDRAWQGRAPRPAAELRGRGAARLRPPPGRPVDHRGTARAHGVRLARPAEPARAAARRAAGRRGAPAGGAAQDAALVRGRARARRRDARPCCGTR